MFAIKLHSTACQRCYRTRELSQTKQTPSLGELAALESN